MEIVDQQDSSLAEQARVLRCKCKPVVHAGAIVAHYGGPYCLGGLYCVLRHHEGWVTISDGDDTYVVEAETLDLYDTGWWHPNSTSDTYLAIRGMEVE